MRAKTGLFAVLAAGFLFMASGIETARAGHYHAQGHSQYGQQAYKGGGYKYGYHGQRQFGHQRYGGGYGYGGGYAYGKRSHFDGGLNRHHRKSLKRIRRHFDNERAFRRYLRHNKPRLFRRYMAHIHQPGYYHPKHGWVQGDSIRRHQGQRHGWNPNY